VKHVRYAPYHPTSNGLAEWFVQSLETALKASKGEEQNWFIGKSIMAKNLRPEPDWIPAVI